MRRTPLFFPLLAVVGSLVGGMGWWAVAMALLLSLVLGSVRVFLCSVLCAAIAWLHAESCSQRAAAVRAGWEGKAAVTLTGTVIEELRHGCVLDTGWRGVRVAIRGDLPFHIGDVVRVEAEPLPVHAAPIPGMFDETRWMKGRGLTGSLAYISGNYLGHPWSWASLRGAGAAIRTCLADRLMQGTMNDPSAQVLCALVLGEKSRAEEETMLPFRQGGCLHAFAVSGLHVGMVAGMLWLLLRLLHLRPDVARVLLLLVIGLYVIVTGLAVPALRAYLMMALYIVGLLLRRRVELGNTWCFLALVILLVEPWQLFHAGFQLSFSIYAAIGIGVAWWLRERPWLAPDDYLPSRLYTRWDRLLCRTDYSLRSLLAVALSAWLVSLVVAGHCFHTINTYGFLTNVAIALLLPLAMGSGLAALALSEIPWLGPMALALACKASSLLLGVVSFFASLPGSYLPLELPRPPEAGMVLGLGYGNSVTVLGNPGLVIDTGNDISARRNVQPALFHAGYHPAAVLLTRSLNSRCGGLSVLQQYWPKMAVLRSEHLPISMSRFRSSAGVFEIYAPPADIPERPAANRAPVVRWHAGQGRVLYVGDASMVTLEQLPDSARHADIVVLGRNPVLPVDDAEILRSFGARRIILLPSASASPLTPEAVAPAELVRVPDHGLMELMP